MVRHGGGRRTKNLQGEREKDKKEKKKERERERERGEGRERRKGKESERESKKACVVGVNTSFELLQNCKRHGKRGRENPGKRLGVKDVRRDRNHEENAVIEDRLRCENRICILFKC